MSLRMPSAALGAMPTTELAAFVIGHEHACKLALVELDRRAGEPPDLDAATSVLRAHGEQRVAPWLAAALLRRIRHPSGYPAVLAILRGPAGDSASAQGYAAEAVARIAGPRSAADLLPWLRDDPSPEVRRGAAHALGLAGARDAIPDLHDAVTRGRIGVRTARAALVDLDVDDRVVAGWLRSAHPADVVLGCAVVFERLERARSHRCGRAPEGTLAPLDPSADSLAAAPSSRRRAPVQSDAASAIPRRPTSRPRSSQSAMIAPDLSETTRRGRQPVRPSCLNEPPTDEQANNKPQSLDWREPRRPIALATCAQGRVVRRPVGYSPPGPGSS